MPCLSPPGCQVGSHFLPDSFLKRLKGRDGSFQQGGSNSSRGWGCCLHRPSGRWPSLQGSSDCLPSLGGQVIGHTHSFLGLSSQAVLLLSETSETSVNQAPVTAGRLQTREKSSCCKKIKLLRLSQGTYRSFKGQRLIYKAASGSRLSQIQCLHQL